MVILMFTLVVYDRRDDLSAFLWSSLIIRGHPDVAQLRPRDMYLLPSTKTSRALLIFSFLFTITITITIGGIALGLALIGHDWTTALSCAADGVCNVGPGLGTIIGPAGNFSTLPAAGGKLTTALLNLAACLYAR